jgi:crotonobetainyl-CoA:carnitine CoA-transferase CaiB-like acyl-CoA transferase
MPGLLNCKVDATFVVSWSVSVGVRNKARDGGVCLAPDPYHDICQRLTFFVQNLPAYSFCRFFRCDDDNFCRLARFNDNAFAQLVAKIFSESNEPVFARTKVFKDEVALLVGVCQREVRRTDGRCRTSATTNANRLVFVDLQVQSSLLAVPHVDKIVVALNRHYPNSRCRCFATVLENLALD